MSRIDRIAILSSLVTACTGVAVYLWNPFHTPSWNPIARIAGIDAFRASSSSMEPTIEQGSIFVANSWPFVGREPAVGDIVTLWHPQDSKAQYVKRIVATGGDRVQLNGCGVTLNGQALREPYANTRDPDPSNLCEMEEIEIPMGHYFVLGDNRYNSMDSRFWGPLTRQNIIGRVNAE